MIAGVGQQDLYNNTTARGTEKDDNDNVVYATQVVDDDDDDESSSKVQRGDSDPLVYPLRSTVASIVNMDVTHPATHMGYAAGCFGASSASWYYVVRKLLTKGR